MPKSKSYFQPLLEGSGYPVSDLKDLMSVEIAHELLGTLLGDKLGSGISREVFALKGSETLVAKIERPGCGAFANVAEFHVWNSVQGTKTEKWFAPSRALSLGGLLLIQDRTTPVPYGKLPSEVPHFFTDLKPSNWGWLGDRVVCHDYALSLLISNAADTTRMRKSGWR